MDSLDESQRVFVLPLCPAKKQSLLHPRLLVEPSLLAGSSLVAAIEQFHQSFLAGALQARAGARVEEAAVVGADDDAAAGGLR